MLKPIVFLASKIDITKMGILTRLGYEPEYFTAYEHEYVRLTWRG